VNHMFVAEPLLAGRPLSPTMQLISTTLCWVMSVGAPLFMRAQFDVWLPSSVCVWTLLWLGMAHLLRRSPRFSGLVSGFPIWSWMQSILAGGVILPSLLLAAWSSKNGAGQDELEGFLLSTWREAPYQIYLEQVHAVLLGYFLKDFWLFYSEGLESGYALHHILSVAGCSMCLCMPGSAGLTSLQAVQVEFASALMSCSRLRPSLPTRVLYACTMSASNAFVGFLTVVVCRLPIPWGYRATYTILAVLIVILRCAGVVVNVSKDWGRLPLPVKKA
jgi:hypothetical protein